MRRANVFTYKLDICSYAVAASLEKGKKVVELMFFPVSKHKQ